MIILNLHDSPGEKAGERKQSEEKQFKNYGYMVLRTYSV